MVRRFALCLVLLASCGVPEFQAWEPRSTQSNSSQIAKRAIMIGQDDLPPIRKAGGLPFGTLTYTGDDLKEVANEAAEKAAQLGGTHFMVGQWSSSESVNVWTVTGSETKHEFRFIVIRVPLSGWPNLPDALTPSQP